LTPRKSRYPEPRFFINYFDSKVIYVPSMAIAQDFRKMWRLDYWVVKPTKYEFAWSSVSV
jgi:hypothetical protein